MKISMTREFWQEHLNAYDLGHYFDALVQYMKPCVRFAVEQVNDHASLEIGTSRLGGFPDLPPEIAWPRKGRAPFEFIGQFNMAEISAYDVESKLPKTGILYVFFDGGPPEYGELSGARVLRFYRGDARNLRRATRYPVGMPSFGRWPPHRLEFETSWMLPDSEKSFFNTALSTIFGWDGTLYRYPPDAHRYWEMMGYVTNKIVPDEEKHHFLGYGFPYAQQDPAWDWPDDKSDWILLLQIQTMSRIDFMWNDMGAFYVHCSEHDIHDGRFDNAQITHQFY